MKLDTPLKMRTVVGEVSTIIFTQIYTTTVKFYTLMYNGRGGETTRSCCQSLRNGGEEQARSINKTYLRLVL